MLECAIVNAVGMASQSCALLWSVMHFIISFVYLFFLLVEDFLREKNRLIEKTMAEKKQLVARLLNVPVDDYDHMAEVARQHIESIGLSMTVLAMQCIEHHFNLVVARQRIVHRFKPSVA